MNNDKIDSPLLIKSKSFALQIINLYKKLTNEKKEFVLSKQVLKSASSIGAMIREAQFAQSKPDFISKLSIGLKESNETLYWLELLVESNFIEKNDFDLLYEENTSILKMLVSSINTLKSK